MTAVYDDFVVPRPLRLPLHPSRVLRRPLNAPQPPRPLVTHPDYPVLPVTPTPYDHSLSAPRPEETVYGLVRGWKTERSVSRIPESLPCKGTLSRRKETQIRTETMSDRTTT